MSNAVWIILFLALIMLIWPISWEIYRRWGEDPAVEINQDGNHVFSYSALRTVVGIIALLIAGLSQSLAAPVMIDSISASYHTVARDVFVGSLMIVGAFLFAYRGGDTRWQTRLSHGHRQLNWFVVRRWAEFGAAKLGAFCVVLVALFPTGDCPLEECPVDECPVGLCPVEKCPVPDYLQLSSEVSGGVHLAAAVGFFACLLIILIVFYFRARAKALFAREHVGTASLPNAGWLLFRTIVYGVCIASMVVGMSAVVWYQGPEKALIAEALGLGSFGLAWFVAGVQNLPAALEAARR